jgi:molybdopterin molybdotransferase
MGEIRAGQDFAAAVEPGQAVAIMTGAAVPHGADSIVMVEHTSRVGNRVRVSRSVAAGENIVPAGAEGKRGEVMLRPGARIGYAETGVAAAVGCERVLVYAKPRVAILATGDEVVDVGAAPAANQIRNSNSYSLAAQVKLAGAEAELLPIAPDEPTRLRELLRKGLDEDLLLIAGGVSMGRYDLVEQMLAEMKAEFLFTGAEIQPGKPVVFGRVPGRRTGVSAPHGYFLGLPGNPISTMVTFKLFAKPIIEALAGMPVQKLMFTQAKLKTEIRTRPGLTRFLPATLTGEFEDTQVERVAWQGSGDIASVARANCYVVITPERDRIAPGEWVPVLLR